MKLSEIMRKLGWWAFALMWIPFLVGMFDVYADMQTRFGLGGIYLGYLSVLVDHEVLFKIGRGFGILVPGFLAGAQVLDWLHRRTPHRADRATGPAKRVAPATRQDADVARPVDADTSGLIHQPVPPSARPRCRRRYRAGAVRDARAGCLARTNPREAVCIRG